MKVCYGERQTLDLRVIDFWEFPLRVAFHPWFYFAQSILAKKAWTDRMVHLEIEESKLVRQPGSQTFVSLAS